MELPTTNQREYLCARFPAPKEFFGVRVSGLRVGHFIALTLSGNPFLPDGRSGEDQYQRGDVAELLDTLRQEPTEIRTRSRRQRLIAARLMFWGDDRYWAEVQRLFEWINLQQSPPECWPAKGAGRSLGGALLSRIQHTLRISDEDFLNRPLKAAIWEWLTVLEEKEAVQIMSDFERNA
tara:strand:- start:5532 stop:6068 length:537 start_codon:yes stop_codon:yes gene_type:complete